MISNKMGAKKFHTKQHLPFYRKRVFWWPVSVVVGLVIVVALLFRLTPWPGALIIRHVFERNGHKTTAAMEAYAPQTGIVALTDQVYKTGDEAAKLDVYFPATVAKQNQKLPVVIWTHGGAWLSGDKRDVAPYLKLIASHGYVAIGVNYSLAPGKTYPTPLHQLNASYTYVQQQAERFHADTGRIILAGDSAGAQLSAQMAALITSPAYAQEVGIVPTLKPEQLKGVVLNCGIYKMEGLTQPHATLPKLIGWGDDVTVWAYSGTSDFSDPIIRQMSPYYHLTAAFPATYISGGNADPLTNAQSKPLADKLQSLRVDVTRLFYAADHKPGLPHEYQFNLGNQDGQGALQATLDFIGARTTQ